MQFDAFIDRRRELRAVRAEESCVANGALFPFDVAVRTGDGRLRRVREFAASRFIAARTAEHIVTQEDELQATVESVSLRLAIDELRGAPDETQTPADHFVTVASADGSRHVVHVAAESREAAIDAVLQERAPGTRPLAITVRWSILGRCGFCNVHLFSDLRIRRNGKGWKCLDCW